MNKPLTYTLNCLLAMNLVMTLLVRDEQDVLRENIEFHLGQGVQLFIVTDNKSVDNTREILEEYEAQGLLRYIFEPEDNYNQHTWVTRMARLAFDDYSADWVINNDADEFWWPNTGNLRDFFNRLPPNYNILKADRFNFVPVHHSDQPFWARMVYRERISINSLGKPLPPKVAHRGSSTVVVHQGNHSVNGILNPQITSGGIEILHFPVRDRQQIENKIRKGGAAYSRNEELPEHIGITWRKLYEELCQEGNLNRYYASQQYDEEQLRTALRSGQLVFDDRLRQFMQRLHSS